MMDIGLAVSRDGRNFEHVGGREPFFRTGPQGSWYSKEVWMLPNPAIHPPTGDLFLFFGGSNMNHNMEVTRPDQAGVAQSGIDALRLRVDGFISLTAPLLGGGINATSVPLLFNGSQLQLNLDTSAGGAMWVGIVDANTGLELPGYGLDDCVPMVVNDVAAPVLWQGVAGTPTHGGHGSVASLQGKVVRLRFRLVGARLYAFQFVEAKI